MDINKIGLLTFDEIVYAGGGNNSNYYLNNNATTNWWWALSPSVFNTGYDRVDLFSVGGDGRLSDYSVYSGSALRSAVSLKSSVQITGGNGTIENPYTIN